MILRVIKRNYMQRKIIITKYDTIFMRLTTKKNKIKIKSNSKADNTEIHV